MKINLKDIAGILFFLACLTYVIGNSVVNDGKARHLDGRYIYVSGATWLAGKSPYDTENFGKLWKQHMVNESARKEFLKEGGAVFAYPPTLGIISIPLALFPWDIAKYILDAVNILFLLLIAWFSALFIKDIPNVKLSNIGIGIGLGCMLAAISTTVFLGQTSLLALVGCLGSAYFLQRKKLWLAALFVVLASIKPHVSLLFVIFLLFRETNWAFLGLSSLFVGLTSMGILMLGGSYNPITEVINIMNAYTSIEFNAPTNMSGLYVILGSLGFSHSTISISPVIGLVITLILALIFRNNNIQNEQNLLQMVLIFSLTAIFLPIHLYDYTIFFLAMMLLVSVEWKIGILLFPDIILIARPNNLANVLPNDISPVLLGSLGAILLAITIVFLLIWPSSSKQV